MSSTPENLAKSEEYVRNFFMYTDHDNEAIQQLYQIGVFRTAVALGKGWEMPDEDVRLARNLEYLKDNFTPGMVEAAELADSESELASFPDVYFRIREVLDSPSSSADDVAKVVSNDVELTARLLKLVNSPFYGLLETVEDVSHAIALVGVNEVTNLALGISAINVFKDIPPELMNMEAFWKHSVSCGVFAKLIASKIPGLNSERYFTAGLLHDVGRLIIFKKLPYASVQTLLHARSTMIPMNEAEKEYLGFTHTDVARTLLENWKFPTTLVDLIANHHDPDMAQDTRGAAILDLADNLTNTMEIAAGGMYVLPGIDSATWERLLLKPSDLIEIVGLFDTHIDELFRSFL